MKASIIINPRAEIVDIELSRNFKFISKDPVALHGVLITLSDISYCANVVKIPIHVDMSKVEHINAQAAILLFSHITSAQLVNRKSDFVKITLPSDLKTRKLVRNSGLWEAIRNGTDRKLDKNWLTVNNFQSGYDPDKHLESTLELIEQKWGSLPRHLGSAINEAMLNIKQHAYSINPPDAIKRWWQYIYIKNNELHFLIFDKGLGIPDSFRLQRQQLKTPDEDIIAYAMKRWVTSTNVNGRGNGSMNIKRPVSDIEKDTLLIYSHNGGYEYHTDGKVRCFKLPVKLAGTLLAWKIGIQHD
ncbi:MULTISPECIES: hypothetical protein [Alteromonas]|uniref:ATP-binding protein n=1 Tax=Alteromonas stellipolaris TaxID=233316 RepID=A0AAW7YZH7_9ALTE|nr:MULTISPECIES: hypothetical protein [Alteromonas]AMJ87029.1 hypothetical protein AV939_10885 [Alteromonas sp. Mac1]AMJ90890.1 hypothetical protein AV940_10655 [Alteromonas sp. Mac2]MDO6576195.1 hypothetical protein [Alteromonas stellipolaris]